MNLKQKNQRGFAAIVAIFLVVVLAALGGFMVTFSNAQHLNAMQDLQGTRAYWAARSGVEWGVATLGTVCPTSPTSFPVDSFSVVVSCALDTFRESGEDVRIFRFTSVATSNANVGDIGFIERSISASITP